MGALRRAGVWLGLVEDLDDHDGAVYEDEFDEEDFEVPGRVSRSSVAAPRPRPIVRPAGRSTRDLERDSVPAERELRLSERITERSPYSREPEPHPREPYRDSPREVVAQPTEPRVRVEEPRAASVRPLARPATTTVSFPTQDNLALAPQVQLRERAVVNEEKPRPLQITTLHPTSFNEARAIGEQFRDGFPVIMNLTEMDEADARRLVDFAAGLAFGLRGSMDRVTNRVFLLSPENVKVSAEDKARIAEGGFFDQG
jgi:cell division inhibitor SepF